MALCTLPFSTRFTGVQTVLLNDASSFEQSILLGLLNSGKGKGKGQQTDSTFVPKKVHTSVNLALLLFPLELFKYMLTTDRCNVRCHANEGSWKFHPQFSLAMSASLDIPCNHRRPHCSIHAKRFLSNKWMKRKRKERRRNAFLMFSFPEQLFLTFKHFHINL